MAGPRSKPPPRRLRKSTHIGPWPGEAYRGFRQLCAEALLLEPGPRTPRPSARHPPAKGLPLYELMSRYLPPSSFPDIAAAEQALREHPVYCWLADNVPLAVDTAGDKTPFVQFRRVRIVAQTITYQSAAAAQGGRRPPQRPVRRDKRRTPLLTAIARIEENLDDGTLSLADSAEEQMLGDLLAVAKQRLEALRRPRGPHGYPQLRLLARELHRQTGTASAQLLLDMAAVCNLNCDARTAQRCVQEARQAPADK